MTVRILIGDALTELRKLPAESVHCCVTSPPYYGLRDYGTAQWEGGDAGCDHSPPADWITKNFNANSGLDGGCDNQGASAKGRWFNADGSCRCGARRIDQQIGLEPSPDEYVAALVAVFREVRHVLRKDGTLWLNIGDSYASSPPGNKTVGVSAKSGLHGVNGASGQYRETLAAGHATKRDTSKIAGIKPKDLIGIPWLLAFALRGDGWYLRQDIIWAKSNPMPESVTDRCTKAHEYLFLLSRSARYYYDAAAIAEASALSSIERLSQATLEDQHGSDRVPGKTNGPMKAVGGAWRNRRSVWEVTTQPFSEAHFATFPPALIEPCIKAGTSEKGCCAQCGAPWVRQVERTPRTDRPNSDGIRRVVAPGQSAQRGNRYVDAETTGWSPSCVCDAGSVPCAVLDPFGGAGTTGLVADRLGRNAVLIELNSAYATMAECRVYRDAPLLAAVSITNQRGAA